MSLSENKSKIISDIYFDEAGYQSVQNTFKEAKLKDKTIKLDDVKQWFKQNVEVKAKPRGYNSYVAEEAFEEFQIDLMFMESYSIVKVALVMIDVFSKYGTIVPVRSKQIKDVLTAIKEGIEKMGGKPKIFYSDVEGAFVSNEIQKFFKEEGITHLTTLSRVPFVDRFIRTVKHMIDKKVRKE